MFARKLFLSMVESPKRVRDMDFRLIGFSYAYSNITFTTHVYTTQSMAFNCRVITGNRAQSQSPSNSIRYHVLNSTIQFHVYHRPLSCPLFFIQLLFPTKPIFSQLVYAITFTNVYFWLPHFQWKFVYECFASFHFCSTANWLQTIISAVKLDWEWELWEYTTCLRL